MRPSYTQTGLLGRTHWNSIFVLKVDAVDGKRFVAILYSVWWSMQYAMMSSSSSSSSLSAVSNDIKWHKIVLKTIADIKVNHFISLLPRKANFERNGIKSESIVSPKCLVLSFFLHLSVMIPCWSSSSFANFNHIKFTNVWNDIKIFTDELNITTSSRFVTLQVLHIAYDYRQTHYYEMYMVCVFGKKKKESESETNTQKRKKSDCVNT